MRNINLNYKKNNLDKILYGSFPKHLKSDVAEVIKIIDLNSGLGVMSPDQFDVKVAGEVIRIPFRIYFDEPNTIKQMLLSPMQKEILYCIFTRHNNGFIREKNLKKIIVSKNDWVIPFIFQLIGEYVIEILSVIQHNLKSLNIDAYSAFLMNNMPFYHLTKQRVISYWDCYYRFSYSNKNEYVGFKIINFFDKNLGVH